MSVKGVGSNLAALLAAWCSIGVAIAEPLPVEQIRGAVDANLADAVSLYREFLALPNDAQYPDDIERLLTWTENAFSERGFETRRVATDGNPFLFAGRHIADDKKTLLIYLQADGQPVDPTAWVAARATSM